MVEIQADEQTTFFTKAKPWIRLFIVAPDQYRLIFFLVDFESHKIQICENERDSLIVEVHDRLNLSAKTFWV